MFGMPIGVFFIGCIRYKESRNVSRLSYPISPTQAVLGSQCQRPLTESVI